MNGTQIATSTPSAVSPSCGSELADVLVRLRDRLEHLPVAGDVRGAVRHRPVPPLRAAPCPPEAPATRRRPSTASRPVGQPELRDRGARVAAADHGVAGRVGDRLGHRARAGRERLQLERAHRAVPEDGAGRARSRARSARRSSGRCRAPSSRPAPRCRRASRLGVGGELVARRPGRRQQQAAVRALGLLERACAPAPRPPPRPASRRSSMPCARKNEKHIAPPISSASAMSRKRSISATLSVTFAPPSTTTSGRSGDSITPRRVVTSFSSSGPAYEGRCSATPAVDACARCADPNASQHERVGQLGQLLGQRAGRSWSRRTPSGCSRARGSRPARAARRRAGPPGRSPRAPGSTRSPISSPSRSDTGASDVAGSAPFGRPRCEQSDQLRARARAAARSRAARRGCARRRSPRRPSAGR